MDWWLRPERADLLKEEQEARGAGHWAHQFCISEVVRGQTTYPYIEEHRREKNSMREPAGVYAKDPLLRAMAAVKGSDLISINKASCADKVVVFLSASSKTLAVGKSWAEDIVPRLARQCAGELDEYEAPLRVILWNGRSDAAGHFMATRMRNN